MKIGDIVIAEGDDSDCKWNICIGKIAKFDKQDNTVGIIILDSKEPRVNPDGECGLEWGDGIRWYEKEQLKIIESK